MISFPKLPLAIIGGIAIGLGAVGWYFYAYKNTPVLSPNSTENIVLPTPTKVPMELTLWDDPAGFTFKYPKDVSVDPHPEDQKNYAHVELTHKDHAGNVIIWMKDLPIIGGKTVSDISTWLKNEKRFVGANTLDTTLGSLPAKKILLTEGEKQLLIIGTIDSDVLLTIEAEALTDTYWQDVHKTIADTFTFSSVAPKNTTGSNTDEAYEEPADEEEVLE